MFDSVLIFVFIFTLGAFGFYILMVYLMPAFFRRRVAKAEMPEAWDKVLDEQLDGFKELTPKEQDRIRKLVKIFMAEKFLEPDELKWDEQILICAILAKNCLAFKVRHLNKLSTIRIGEEERHGHGILCVPSINHLYNIDLKRWC